MTLAADANRAWPETVAVTLWGLNEIKTRGEAVAVVLVHDLHHLRDGRRHVDLPLAGTDEQRPTRCTAAVCSAAAAPRPVAAETSVSSDRVRGDHL